MKWLRLLTTTTIDSRWEYWKTLVIYTVIGFAASGVLVALALGVSGWC